MTTYVIAFLIVVVLVVGALGAFSAAKTESNNQAYIAQQETERTRLTEQTKQDALLLRAEESSRVVNYVAIIAGPIVILGLVLFFVVVSDNKMTRNRMYELQHMAALERERIRVLKELEEQKLLEQANTRYLTGRTNRSERYITVYDDYQEG